MVSHCVLLFFFCISLITKYDEHLFMCLFVTYVSFLEKCLFTSFALLKIRLFIFLLLNYRSSLYILDINPFSDT